MSTLSPRARTALDALCRRIVPVAYDDGFSDLAAVVERRIATLEPGLQRDIRGALHFFDNPVTGMLLSGRPRRFSTLPPMEQDALLREWERSSLALRRTVVQALRRLVLATFYAQPRSHAAIGFLAPLHLRAAVVDWEGAAPGPEDPADPIARSATAGRVPPSPVERDWTPDVVARVTRGGALPRSGVLRADVCIIGSGAGGAVAAAHLAEAGFDVIVLEEGGLHTSVDFDDDEVRLTPQLYADAAARTTDDASIVLLQGRSAGGGTTVNWMLTLRPQPWVMHEWEHEHRLEILSGRALTPALERVEHDISARPVPDDAHAPANRVILDGSARLGWQTLEARVNVDGCVRAGSCSLGCRWGAKRSAGAVYLPRAVRAGARLICDARAERIEVIENGGRAPLKRVTARSIGAADTGPATFSVEAPIVVLAGGAVGTPALLEQSGLGGGGVGRWLRLHPCTGVFGHFDRVMYAAAGIPQSAVGSEYLRGNDGYGFWIESVPLRPALAAAALPGFGARHRSYMQKFTHIAPLIALVRDGAERSRSSGDVRVDRSGRTRIRYRLSRSDRRTLVAGVQAAARLQLAAGAEYALTLQTGTAPIRTDRDIAALTHGDYRPNSLGLFSAHVNGTCRLGHDPRDSGCTPDGQRHGVPGLYVADGSLLPTAPGVNPQATIMALASLIADRIIQRHRPG